MDRSVFVGTLRWSRSPVSLSEQFHCSCRNDYIAFLNVIFYGKVDMLIWNQILARKPLGSGDDDISYGDTRPLLSSSAGGRDEDLPENKYKRRSAGEWLNRWLR